MELAEKRYAQWLAQQGLEPELREELTAMHSDAETVTDAFYRDLEFGTAGLRGVLGAGTNRMNIYVIRRATQAVAQYLNETELPKTVAIGHDSRIKSDVFAREAAAVFAANGITAYLYPRLEPVPALSFAVRHLHCGLGVCVTASHNPAEYNGYKVYGSDGCQMTPEAAKRVVALLEHMDYFTSAKTTDFDAALAAGSIRYIPDEVLDAFVDAVYAQRVGSGEGIENLKLVYTPLNGAGLECVKKLTQKLGIRNMTIVKEQEQPDGHFPTCPYPNPEIRQAMELGLQYCDRVHPDILIGTDPDCDRIGAGVRQGDTVTLISGNDMGVLLLDYVCSHRKAQKGELPPVAVKTIVTTEMAVPICKKYGVELRNVLTGFKFIGEQIGLLEKEGHTERYIFGFEESYGYLSGTSVRDKDAVNAAVLVCEMAANYKAQGLTLLDKLEQLREEFGFYAQRLLTFQYEGESGAAKMADIMRKLRAPLDTFADAHFPTATRIDYQNDETGLPKSDVLSFALADGSKIIVRPSGTEPKLKAYLFARGENQAAAEKVLDELETLMNGYCKE